MPPPSVRGDIESKAAALASRLRLAQATLADDPPETRRRRMEDEVERAVSGMPPGDRDALLAAVGERFPSWDANVGAVHASPAAVPAPVQPRADDRELQDPAFLVARLVELAGTMSPDDRQAAAQRLRSVGLAAPGDAGLPDGPAKGLQTALGHGPKDGLDAARALELATLLVEFASSLDQVVWNTWKAIAPQSPIKRSNPAKATMARFASGDADVARAQVKQDLERLRQLTAALTASVNQAGRQFAQTHVEKFGPAEIEQLAKMTGGGLLVGHEVKCWRKYVELAGPVDAQAIERDLLAAIAAYAESLMKGTGR